MTVDDEVLRSALREAVARACEVTPELVDMTSTRSRTSASTPSRRPKSSPISRSGSASSSLSTCCAG